MSPAFNSHQESTIELFCGCLGELGDADDVTGHISTVVYRTWYAVSTHEVAIFQKSIWIAGGMSGYCPLRWEAGALTETKWSP